MVSMETKSVRRTAWLLTGATPFGRARRGILCFVLLAVVSTSSVADDPPSSDAWSLDAIFAEQHVTNSGWTVHNRAMELSPEERYEFLSRWVLPGEDHNSIRLQIAFSPTSPAPAVQRSIRDQKEHSLRDTASGGQLVSPVYDLIDVAHELDNLKDVNDRIQEWTPPTTSVAQFEKLALLTLCAMKTGEPNTPDLLREFIAATPQEIQPDRAPSPPEWLVYHRAIEVPDYALIVGDPIYRYLGWVNADFDKPIPERHWSGMMGLVRTKLATESDTEIPNNSPVPHPEWTAVSMATARTRGLGSPPTHWLLDPGEATNLASHDNDYLYYSVPMRGNFEVECDVTSFGWRDSQLLAAGFWVAPVYTLEDYDLGTIRQTFPRQSIGVTLSKVRDWIHYRTVVRDNVARTYFNGRLIHTQGIEADHDPWLAVRSSYRHDGGVRNVRITGTPTIPESIDLSSDPDLDCWIPYYGEPVNESAPGWRGTNNEIVGFGYVGGISANESEDSHIGHEQRLLRYHRPLLEDGSLEYEFLYVPGRIHVHPALDRLVLLLTPEGVRIHWANDGPFERTELAANNVFDEPENRRGPAELPLIDGQWNKVRLSIEGDQLSVVLNDVTVYERELELTNSRAFGLFHYADRTQARARNVVMRGDWPRSLPKVADQFLSLPEAEFLDREIEHLQASFSHDFSQSDDWQEKFTLLKGELEEHFETTPDGLKACRVGTPYYLNATIAADLKIEGDFDIVAEYQNFDAEVSPDGGATAYLLAVLENEARDEHFIMRRHLGRGDEKTEDVVQCAIVQQVSGKERRNHFVNRSMEESSGRLRLARRGDKLYYLTSEEDSPHFRLQGEIGIASDPIGLGGLRLLSQIHKPGHVSVTWKSLSVRAEKLSGRGVSGEDPRLANLRKHREQLAARISHDFTTTAPNTLFGPWGRVTPWQQSDGGWKFVSPGANHWTAHGVNVNAGIIGDFDLAVSFESLKLDSSPGKRAAVYWQLDQSRQNNDQISLINAHTHDGRKEVIVQTRNNGPNGKANYSAVDSVDIADACELRIVRRGETMTFLAKDQTQNREMIIAELGVGKDPIPPGQLRFMVNTGGEGRESIVILKFIDLRADNIQGNGVQIQARPPGQPTPPPPRPKSPFDSFLDLFR